MSISNKNHICVSYIESKRLNMEATIIVDFHKICSFRFSTSKNTQKGGHNHRRPQKTLTFLIFNILKRPTDGRKEGSKDGRTEGRKQGRTDGRKEGSKVGRTDGRKEGRTDGRADGRAGGRAGRHIVSCVSTMIVVRRSLVARSLARSVDRSLHRSLARSQYKGNHKGGRPLCGGGRRPPFCIGFEESTCQ